MHVPNNLRKKLDDKSKKCVFIGVSDESKAYRLYEPLTKKVLVSRDVTFDETKYWDWDSGQETEKNKAIDCDLEEGENELCEGTSSQREEASSSQNPDLRNEPVEESENSSDSDSESNELETRIRKKPVWWKDYSIGNSKANIIELDSEKLREELFDDTEMQNSELQSYAVVENSSDPVSFSEAVEHKIWRVAMDAEIKSIEKNDTWQLVDLPPEAKQIGVKWVYKTKFNEEGRIEKHKARLVAKGYSQRAGVDFEEVFAPVARWDTIRCILALAAGENWEVFQLDVKSAFLHGELEETVFVEQPQGYEKKGMENKVYRLKKALYGLRQAPRAWYSRIDSYFIKEGFTKCPHEPTLYTKRDDMRQKTLIVSLYVDDLIYTGNDALMIEHFRNSMEKEFDMSNLGRMRYFLGVEVIQNAVRIFITQQKYSKSILDRFGMGECKAVSSPISTGCKLSKASEDDRIDSTLFKQIMGSLIYLNATRPDIMYAVCLICRFMENPGEQHFMAAKRVMRYLQGTHDTGLLYRKGEKHSLIGFCDSDYAGSVEDRRSTSGYVFMLNNAAISWSSKKQPIVTLSTTESEYVAAAYCTCQGIWLSKVIESLGLKQKQCLTVMCDNNSTIKLSRNPVLHGRSKHIDVRFHFLRDLTNSKLIELKYCPTKEQLADIFTKALKQESFDRLKKLMSMTELKKVQENLKKQASITEIEQSQ